MRHGFSLVELSIVLVILGLLTGGILAGQSLIRAAELRAVPTEHARYLGAIHAFRDKYFALPGDMSSATKFWGTSGTCPGTNASPSTTAATCDGNGNGILDENAPSSNEYFRFWQHLANAGLVEGTYAGVANSATATSLNASIGMNVPRSKLSGAGWTPGYIPNATISSGTYFDGSYGNVFVFGGEQATELWTSLNLLKPEEAWNIDTKMDDGKPGMGKIVTAENRTACHDAGTSTTVALAASANYQLSNSTLACFFFFRGTF